MNTEAARPNPPRIWGLLGTIVGALALAAALLHFFAGPFAPQPQVEDQVADLTVRIGKAIADRVRGKDSAAETVAAPARDVDDYMELGVVTAGLAAVFLGLIAFIRREDARPTAVAVLLGGGALAFQIAMAVVAGILGVILIIGIVSAVVQGELPFG